MLTPRARAILGLLLVCSALLALAFSGDLRQRVALFFVLYAVAVAGYLLLASAPGTLRIRIVVVAALAVRLAFLPATPSLSDDYHRYLWDGRVQQAGVNPYKYAPASARLDDVVYPDRQLVNHPGVRTIYPPLSEALFYSVALAGGGLPALKTIFGLFELLTALVIVLLVPRRRRSEVLTLYLLCPLMVLETWSSAHLETVAVFFTLAATLLLVRERDTWAGIALGLAAAFKLTPAFLLIPALLGGRTRPLRFLSGFALAFGLPYLPYLLSGGARGSFGSFYPTGNALGVFLLDKLMPTTASVLACGALAVGAAVWVSLRLPGRERTAEAFAWTATALLLVVPVIHSWYWLTPAALAIVAGRRMPVYLGLAGVAGEAAYAAWPLYRGWLHLLTYAPLLAGLPKAVRGLRGRRRDSRRASPAQSR